MNMADQEGPRVAIEEMELTVIILDDDEQVLEEMTEYLRAATRNRWTVLPTSTSSECLDTIANNDPHVIIVDEQLFGDEMQGHQVLRKLFTERPKGAALPILVLLTVLPRRHCTSHSWPLGDVFLHKADFARDPQLLFEKIRERYQHVPGAGA